MFSVQAIIKSQQVNVTKAGRYMEGLDALGTPAAEKLKGQMVEHLDKVGASIKAAGEVNLNVSEARDNSHHADQWLKDALGGTVSLIQLISPSEASKLPSPDAFATLDVDVYATRLVAAMEESPNEKLHVLAGLLNQGRHKRLSALRAYEEACDQRTKLQSAKADLAELGQLLKAAEALILRVAKAGSPALESLKPVRNPSSSKSSKSSGKSKESGQSSTPPSSSQSQSSSSQSSQSTSSTQSPSSSQSSAPANGQTQTPAPTSPSIPAPTSNPTPAPAPAPVSSQTGASAPVSASTARS
jgi:hypothetical protein